MKLSSCPICRHRLSIRKYYCEKCDVEFTGEFETNVFEALSAEQIEFARLFLIVQGNIKEMEKLLNISYPTVKNRLAEIIRLIKGTEPATTDFSDIMNDLDEGFISVNEAISMIESRRKK